MIIPTLSVHRLLPLLLIAATALAQAPATGTLTGRVSFADNGEYLELARVSLEGTGLETLTDGLGSYTFGRVPAGEVRVRVYYTGLLPEIATVSVNAGQIARRDFSLASAERRPGATGETVKLAQFVVATSREMDGASIAINDQRFAPDLRKVIAADEFGTTADGSVGELLKNVPGVSIAWVGGEAMNIQLEGVPADYVPVTVNGFEQASAQANTARNIQMTTVATNNLSRIEVRFSPTPETPGMALAGSVNMVVRSAFERARPAFNLSAYLLMRDDARDFHPTPGPSRWRNRKVHPGFEFSYVKPVNERFGFTLSGGTSTQYQPSTFVQTTWRGPLPLPTATPCPTPPRISRTSPTSSFATFRARRAAPRPVPPSTIGSAPPVASPSPCRPPSLPGITAAATSRSASTASFPAASAPPSRAAPPGPARSSWPMPTATRIPPRSAPA